MALIVKTIGSGGTVRDFATVAGWEATLPANFVTDGNSQEGDMYNDPTAFTLTASFGAHTTDASHFMLLTAGPGQSFQDAAGVRSNALSYNTSNGVGWNVNVAYTAVLSVVSAISFLTISRIQFKQSRQSSCLNIPGMDIHGIIKDCIIDTVNGSSVNVVSSAGTIINVLLINRGGGSGWNQKYVAATFIGCTFVECSNEAATGTALLKAYAAPIVESCAVFGFSTALAAGYSASCKNNATNLATLPGSSNQTSVTYNSTSPFTQAADSGTLDFRAVAATSLAANGFQDATNAPNDISGTARSATPTIGAWELTGAGPTVQPRRH